MASPTASPEALCGGRQAGPGRWVEGQPQKLCCQERSRAGSWQWRATGPFSPWAGTGQIVFVYWYLDRNERAVGFQLTETGVLLC